MNSIHTKNPFKRGRDDDPYYDSDSDTEKRSAATRAGVVGAWPRFLVVEGTSEERPLSKIHPFAIQKCFDGVSSTGFESIKKLRNGSYLVECKSKRASELLLKVSGSSWLDRPIRVTPHKGLNTSKGVLRCADLQDVPEDEIQSELQSQGVLDVKRVYITKEGKKIPTNTLFLTFAMAKLPESVKVGYILAKITPFVPSPLRCFKCQKFGHTSSNCSAKEVCRNCSKDKHEGDCSAAPQCVNCEGKHPSSSKDCPKWKLEVEIQRIKTLERCSFADARKKAMAQAPPTSYARTVASSAVPERGIVSENAIEKLVTAITALVQRVDKMEKQMSSFMAKQGTKPTQPPPGATTQSPPGTPTLPPHGASHPSRENKPQQGVNKHAPPGQNRQAPPGLNRQAPPGHNKPPVKGKALIKAATRTGSASNLLDLKGVATIKGLTKKDIHLSPSKTALPTGNRSSSFEDLEDGMETET